MKNLFMPYATNKGADKPAHPRSLISTFIVCCLDRIIHLVSISEISSLYIASVVAQAGLSLPCRKPEDRFSHDVARMIWTKFDYSCYKHDGCPFLIVMSCSSSFEPPHDKTNKMACAPSEDSDQPGHQPSLVFAVRTKKAWVFTYPLSTQRKF